MKIKFASFPKSPKSNKECNVVINESNHLKLCKSNAYEHAEHHKTKYCLSVLKMRMIFE